MEDRTTSDGRPLPIPMIMLGGGDNGTVKAFLAETGELAFEQTPFDGFSGGVRVAAGDLDHDGMPDLIAAAGPSGGPHVKVYSGRTGDLLRDLFAYDAAFAGGVFVASGDVTGDGWEDLITAARFGGGPHIKVFDGETGAEVYSFYAFAPTFNGGATVMAADFSGDGRADLAVGAGPGGGPHVKIFDLSTGDTIPGPLGSFYAFDPSCSCGVDVGTSYLTGDITGDGKADLVVGTGPGVGSLVRVFDGVTGAVAGEFSPYGSGMTSGVRVSTAFVDDDIFADIVVGPGPGAAMAVKVFGGTTLTELAAPQSPYTPFGENYTGGVYVAGSNDPDTVTISATFPGTVNPGGKAMFTATVTDAVPYNGMQTPTGTVTFRTTVNGTTTTLGVANLTASGTAGTATGAVTVSPITLPPGTYYVTPVYSGDNQFLSKTGMPYSFTVMERRQIIITNAVGSSTTSLKVAKWSWGEHDWSRAFNGGSTGSGTPTLRGINSSGYDFIDGDPDRFNIRVKDLDVPVGTNTVDVSIGTINNPDPAYNDPPNLIRLVRVTTNQNSSDWGWFWSDAQILVSNEADDKFEQAVMGYGHPVMTAGGIGTDDAAPGVAVNQKLGYSFPVSDRTHSVSLGGQVMAVYGGNGAPLPTIADVPVRKKINLTIYRMQQPGVSGVDPNGQPTAPGAPFVSEADVEADVKSMKEIYAQVGIKVVHTIKPPVTVVPGNNLDLADGFTPFASAETYEFLNQQQRTGQINGKDDVEIFYINNFPPAANTIAFAISKSDRIDPQQVNAVIIAPTRWWRTLAHEVGHVLDDTSGIDPHYPYDWDPKHDTDRVNLMVEGGERAISDLTIFGSRRLTQRQQDRWDAVSDGLLE